MAIRFNGSTYARCTTGTPIGWNTGAATFAIWVRILAKTGNQVYLGSFSNSGVNGGTYLGYDHGSNNLIMVTYQGSTWRSSPISCPPVGEWFHLAGVCTGSTWRRVYLNGVAGTVNASGTTGEPMEEIIVGGYRSVSSIGALANADLAHAAVWWGALPQTQILTLARGASPLDLRQSPAGTEGDRLAAYYPLQDNRDWRNRQKRQDRRFHLDTVVGNPIEVKSNPAPISRAANAKLLENPEPKVIAAPSPYISGARIRDRWAGLGRRY